MIDRSAVAPFGEVFSRFVDETGKQAAAASSCPVTLKFRGTLNRSPGSRIKAVHFKSDGIQVTVSLDRRKSHFILLTLRHIIRPRETA